MPKRFVSIWFGHLVTDWFSIRRPALRGTPFVVCRFHRGRKLIVYTNRLAESNGIYPGMAAADARALVTGLEVLDDIPGKDAQLLTVIGHWLVRFTPIVSIDPPDGILLDATGCAHLWGDETSYLSQIVSRLQNKGYDVRAAMADTIGSAWAVTRFGKTATVIEKNQHTEALLSLPPAALRLEDPTLASLRKLGFSTINSFVRLPRPSLRRRFGQVLLNRLDQALGIQEETIVPLQEPQPYSERMASLEPIVTGTGIAIALRELLGRLCARLQTEGKGLRKAIFSCYRVDGKTEQISIGTNHASNDVSHLFHLFGIHITGIEPALGIELFILEAPNAEDIIVEQKILWTTTKGWEDKSVAELLDRLAGKLGAHHIHRYLPDEHYWPERSLKAAASLQEKPAADWPVQQPRPLLLFRTPVRIEVTAPIPDYPPMLFRYKGKLHTIKKADGPERIEREWWIEEGLHRDYYCVEDEEGLRYWLFRLGHYKSTRAPEWFLHGFFS